MEAKPSFDSSSSPIERPLGRYGEITEWLAVKRRRDGRVRSMTMKEAIDYHEDEIWQFPVKFDGTHTAAHVITALVYGDKVTPHDYQSTYQAEMIVIPIEDVLNGLLNSNGNFQNKEHAKSFFIEHVGINFEKFYARSMLYRTLM